MNILNLDETRALDVPISNNLILVLASLKGFT